MGKKKEIAKKSEKELRAEIQEEIDRYRVKHVVPTSRKRSFRELRKEFNAFCENGEFERAWEISKLYHKRWFERHR